MLFRSDVARTPGHVERAVDHVRKLGGRAHVLSFTPAIKERDAGLGSWSGLPPLLRGVTSASPVSPDVRRSMQQTARMLDETRTAAVRLLYSRPIMRSALLVIVRRGEA